MKKLLLTLMLFTIASFGFAQTENFTTSTTWQCPSGITSVKVECWGAGGGGGSATASTGRAGGGGGGGSYLVNTITVIPGQTYTITVGVGGTPGNTTTITTYGNPGGSSQFSGPSITSLTASGGGAASVTSSQNLYSGIGGVLGGVYAVNLGSGGSGYSSSSTSITGGGGTGATLTAGQSSGVISSISVTNQGSGYTSTPTVTFATGTGGAATALFSLSVDAGGTIIKGTSGSNGIFNSGSGAGGAGAGPNGSADGGAGGLGQTTQGGNSNAGTAPGGGGGGGYASATSKVAAAGADGQVKLTYGILLPVTLTSFTAQKQATGVQLKWNTASEQNNSHFDVQRSADGVTFSNLGKVTGAGNSSSSIDYYYTDKSPATGTNYYRLNQVDFDGKTAISKPVFVNMGFSNASMQVYASSNSLSNLNISISAEQASAGQLVIYNMSGQKVYEKAISLNKGNNDLSISLSNTDKGIFIATYNNGSQVLKKKFVK